MHSNMIETNYATASVVVAGCTGKILLSPRPPLLLQMGSSSPSPSSSLSFRRHCSSRWDDNNTTTTRNKDINNHDINKMKMKMMFIREEVMKEVKDDEDVLMEKKGLVKMMREARPYLDAHRGATFVVVVSSFLLHSLDLLHPLLQVSFSL